MTTKPSFEHEERVRQALDSFDLTLTRDEDVRYLAHGASKALELAAAARDHSCVAALIAEGGEITKLYRPYGHVGPGRYLVFPIPAEEETA